LAPYEIHSKEDEAIPGDSLFDVDKAVIKPTAEKILKAWLKRLNHRTTHFVKIEGHTDSDGSKAHNVKLSFRRAHAVKDWFTQHGVRNPESLFPVGAGEARPVAPNDTKEGRQKNRRVEITQRV
jgi:outer membrane protein OmpA-like peptidoglycan-associated protein